MPSRIRLLPSLLAVLLTLAIPRPAPAIDDPPCEIGLALGSGGAAGLAHIAMLEVFDDLETAPSMIAGTSIGAVIGALYAAGLDAARIRALFEEFGGSGLDALSELAGGDNGLDLRDVMNLDLEHGGLVDPAGFIEFLAAQTDVQRFEDLRIPLEVVATDYWTGRTVILDDGDLFEAVQASMAVPGLFSPVRNGERLLIDGGTTNPLPVDRLRARCRTVIAVDVSGARPQPGDEAGENVSDLLFGSFELMQQALIRQARLTDPPDLYLRPEIRGVRLLHFNRIDRVLAQAAPGAERLRAFLLRHPRTDGASP